MDFFTRSTICFIVGLYGLATILFWRRAIVDSNGYTQIRVFIGTLTGVVTVAYILAYFGILPTPFPIIFGLTLVTFGGLSLCMAALTIGGFRH